MEIDLRPLNLGEVLDRTFQIFRSRFLMFVGIALVWTAASLLMQGSQFTMRYFLKAGDHPHPALLLVFGIYFLCLMFLAIAVSTVAFAAVFRAVADMYTGVPTGVVRAYSAVWRGWFRYLRVYFSLVMVAMAPFIAWMFVVVMGALLVVGLAAAHVRAVEGTVGRVALFAIAGFVMAACLVLSVWLGLRYSLSGPACVFENVGVVQSFRRSAILSKGQRWRVVILTFLVVAIQLVVLGVFMVPVIPFMIRHHGVMPTTGLIAMSVAASFAGLLSQPILGIGWMVCYFDARIRREGFDVEWRLQRSAATSALTEANPDEVPPALPPPEITGLNPA